MHAQLRAQPVYRHVMCAVFDGRNVCAALLSAVRQLLHVWGTVYPNQPTAAVAPNAVLAATA